MLESFFNTFKPKNGEGRRSIGYALNLEDALSSLEKYLHSSDDPTEIAMGTLKTACDFYQADWASVIVADLELDIWAPFWCYNTNREDKTTEQLSEFESSVYLENWAASMKENSAVIVRDTEAIKEKFPEEYSIYKRLHAKSVLGVPFKPRPMGFLVVRNPKRYIERSSMLQMLAFVVLTAVNEKKALDAAKMAVTPDRIKKDTDIIINVFGSLEIYTSKGVLREDDLKSPKICRLLLYLLINRRSSHPPREIAEALWYDETADPEAVSANLRGLVYRFRQLYSLISEHQLIESTANGYRLNPDLNIMTDMENFDLAWQAVHDAVGTARKMELLLQAFAIFKGEMYPPASGEHWMMNTSNYYSLRYIGLVNELLNCFAEHEEWEAVTRYAAESIRVLDGNVKAYYWLVYSMYHTGAVEMAKSEAKRAKSVLTEEEYEGLLTELEKARTDSLYS